MESIDTLTSVSSYESASSDISSPDVSSTTSNHSTKTTSVTSYLPPCRLCGATASGFHYGANTCEACKAFFRRCTSKDFQAKPCPNNGECTELIRGRLVCVPCRFDKCLQAGMTKSASKKGRYTHERRTQYTNEIKAEELKKNGGKPNISPELPQSDILLYQHTIDQLNRHSLECFPELNTLMQHKSEIDKRIDKLIAERCPESDPETPIYSPGNSDKQPLKAFSEKFTTAAQQLQQSDNSPSSSTISALHLLWQNWMLISEMLFIQLTKFAKTLPGFADLPIDDKVILLKAARIEASTLMGSPGSRPEKNLIGLYSASTDEIVLTPIMMFPDEAFNERHNKVMARLKKADYNMEELNVIMALVILSPDRDGLQQPKKVEQLQSSMLKIMEYTLRKRQGNTANRFAETLLILPDLREISEQMRALLYAGKEETNPDLSPLINEVL